MNTAMLAPAAVLIAWSLVMLVWVMITRFPAFKGAGIDLATAEPGGRYVDAEPMMPAKVNWKAHNLNHLMEQPTIFYAVVCILAIAGAPDSVAIWAWGYTGLRIVHSLWQSLVNKVPVRFMLFLASSICLMVLTYHALRLTLA